MLDTYLQSHPRITMHGEVFGEWGPMAVAGLDYDDGTPAVETALRRMRDRDPVAFLEELVLEPGDFDAVGFKLKYEEMVLPRYASLVDHMACDPTIKVIQIRRENLLARYLSEHVARHVTQVFHTKVSEKVPKQAVVRLEPDDCEEDFRRIERWQDDFCAIFGSHSVARVSYEELVDNIEPPLDQLQDFIGVDRRRLQTYLQRLRTTPLSKSIENWDELREYFCGGPYAGFFEDR